MKCNLVSEQPVTDAACKTATGKSLAQWYGVLDSREALKDGRRNTVRFLMEEKLPDWWATTVAVEYEKQAGPPKKDGLHEGYGICSTKTIAAPLDKVFSAWTDPSALSKWLGAGAKADVRDGGSFSNSDGNKGSYQRVRADKDLRFSWEDPAFGSASLVDVLFSDKGGGKTGLIVNHSRIQTRPEADGLRAAWGEALTKLKALLEA